MVWPVPAVVSWLVAWGLCLALQRAAAPVWAVWLLPTLLGAALASWPRVAATPWRQVFVAAGFPASALALAPTGGLPAWVWLVPLGVLLLAYPRQAWRDAPVFPTPAGALRELPSRLPLADGARIHDAGCGLGDGLKALREAYPAAQLTGIEWSWLWWAVARLRCPWARVQRGDMWAVDWSGFEVVYLFQRPETMPRAMDKARREMRPGSWLVSLEFEARDAQGQPWPAHAVLRLPAGDPAGRPVWVYQLRADRHPA